MNSVLSRTEANRENKIHQEFLHDMLEELRVQASRREHDLVSKPECHIKLNQSNQSTVLIVEDNTELRDFLIEALSDDFNILVANDGLEGLAKAIKYLPDVIVTDVMMPNMNGDQMVAEIRLQKTLDDTPIILLTAKSDTDLRLQLLQHGAQDYITKPFSLMELKARIYNFSVLKKTKDLLKEKNAILAYTNQELESFSHSVSHDLRAPVRSIIGFGNILLEDYYTVLDKQGQNYLTRIVKAGNKMGELIDGLLNLSRLTRTSLKTDSLDLSQIIRYIVTELQESEPDRQVTCVIPDNITAQGDQQLLQIVLQNLFANAWKYTRKQKVAHIEFGICMQGDKTIYFVRDNGVGFDMAYIKNLFGVFQRLHSVDEFDGIGIGLATVQRIIHRHGGSIWAEGIVNQGATFFFTLYDHVAR